MTNADALADEDYSVEGGGWRGGLFGGDGGGGMKFEKCGSCLKHASERRRSWRH